MRCIACLGRRTGLEKILMCLVAFLLYSSIYETEKDLECEKKEAEDLKQIDQENAAIVYEGDSWKACEAKFADMEVHAHELKEKLNAIKSDACSADCEQDLFLTKWDEDEPAAEPDGN